MIKPETIHSSLLLSFCPAPLKTKISPCPPLTRPSPERTNPREVKDPSMNSIPKA
ncbi:uncharacterized protein BO95DRAFT_440322, partial [Aspergillus brunneoviolaceus CBS 621.78]